MYFQYQSVTKSCSCLAVQGCFGMAVLISYLWELGKPAVLCKFPGPHLAKQTDDMIAVLWIILVWLVPHVLYVLECQARCSRILLLNYAQILVCSFCSWKYEQLDLLCCMMCVLPCALNFKITESSDNLSWHCNIHIWNAILGSSMLNFYWYT